MKNASIDNEDGAIEELIGLSGTAEPSQRLCRLDSAALCYQAQRRVNCQDFGDPPVQPALSVLVNSLDKEADLHLLGRFLMRSHLQELLQIRLQLHQAWDGQSPAVAAAPIEQPIFITGMPRSGSTFLHELLAEDPGHRVPRVWETMFPLAAAQPRRPGSRNDSVWKTSMRLWCFRCIARKADAVHPIRAQTPHECVAIHSYTFISEEFLSSCKLPSYEKFLRASDLRPAYFWQRRFLQHLQQHSPGKRWVLKSPDHMRSLDALFSAFPDARIIQTHRNPLDVLKSVIRLVDVVHKAFAHPRPREELAARELRILTESMDEGMRFRDEHPELADRFIDVEFSQLTTNPLAVVRQIYSAFNMQLSNAAAERMQQLAAKRTRYSGWSRNPSLTDLGLDIPAIAKRFGSYCGRFGIQAAT